MSTIDGLKRALELANQIKSELGNTLDISLIVQRLEKEIDSEYKLMEAYLEEKHKEIKEDK